MSWILPALFILSVMAVGSAFGWSLFTAGDYPDYYRMSVAEQRAVIIKEFKKVIVYTGIGAALLFLVFVGFDWLAYTIETSH